MNAKPILNLEPKFIINDAKMRGVRCFPFALRIGSCDASSGRGVADIANFVPDNHSSIDRDAQHPGSLVPRTI